MTQRNLAARAETFGFDTDRPWALDTFRLLFNVPRAFAPLVRAWGVRHPGADRALQRLVAAGFVAHQPAIVVDTRTGTLAAAEGRRMTRWRATAKGKRALAEFLEDQRTFEDRHPRASAAGASTAIQLLRAFDLDDAHSRHGISAIHAMERAAMPVRLGRWWMQQFEEAGYILALPHKIADVREVIPAHWRITRLLCRQLDDVFDAYGHAHLRAELRLARSKFLGDIDPARIGLTGATDYDHDVESQRVIAAVLGSNDWAGNGVFSVEPRIVLPVDQSNTPWTFDLRGGGTSFYQPDAEFRGVELLDGRPLVRRYVIEYERFQSRRDAWAHIERFLGYMHTRALVGEGGVLLFVVDTDSRRRSYVQLIEAFADHMIDAPHLLTPNPVTLAVSSVDRVLSSENPLNLREWNRLQLPAGAPGSCIPVLHATAHSPYDAYFGKS